MLNFNQEHATKIKVILFTTKNGHFRSKKTKNNEINIKLCKNVK